MQRPPVCDLCIQHVQLLQHTAIPAVQQIPQIVRHIVRHGIAAGRQYGIRQIILFGQCTKGGLQRLDDRLRIGRFHRPDGNGPRDACGMGVRDVKVVLQTPFSMGFIHDSNTGSPGVDPPAKLTVPFFQLQHRRGIGTLGVDQNLLVKRTFVVIARRTQETRPALIIAGQLCQCAAI